MQDCISRPAFWTMLEQTGPWNLKLAQRRYLGASCGTGAGSKAKNRCHIPLFFTQCVKRGGKPAGAPATREKPSFGNSTSCCGVLGRSLLLDHNMRDAALGPFRLSVFSLGILLIVVAVGAPHGVLSMAELGAGAALICLAIWVLSPARKKGVALKDLPWIKSTKSGNGSDPKTGA